MNKRDQKILAVRKAVDAFNLAEDRPYDDFHGKKVYHYARQPILATDCDYEVVTVSGVRGMRLPS
jgi:hypothetical protein